MPEFSDRVHEIIAKREVDAVNQKRLQDHQEALKQERAARFAELGLLGKDVASKALEANIKTTRIQVEKYYYEPTVSIISFLSGEGIRSSKRITQSTTNYLGWIISCVYKTESFGNDSSTPEYRSTDCILLITDGGLASFSTRGHITNNIPFVNLEYDSEPYNYPTRQKNPVYMLRPESVSIGDVEQHLAEFVISHNIDVSGL